MNLSKIKNLIYLLLFLGALLALKFLIVDKLFPDIQNDAQIWFTSGLLLIILGIFVTEKYFTRPIDVIVNVLTVLVVLMMLEHRENFVLFYPFIFYICLVAILATTSFTLGDLEKDRNLMSQKIANSANIVSSFLGSSKMLFSIIFILSIFSYFIVSIENSDVISKKQVAVILLIVFWGVAILIESIDKIIN